MRQIIAEFIFKHVFKQEITQADFGITLAVFIVGLFLVGGIDQ